MYLKYMKYVGKSVTKMALNSLSIRWSKTT